MPAEILLQYCLRQLGAWNPGVVAFVFRKILKSPKLFKGQHILGGLSIQSSGIDIQTARRLLRGFSMQLLPLTAQQPIEKKLCGVGVRGALDDADDAVAAADISALFERRQMSDR